MLYFGQILNSSNTNDLRNVRLGLAVTENINSIANYNLRSPFTFPVLLPSGSLDLETSSIPMSGVMNPLSFNRDQLFSRCWFSKLAENK